jgi:sugar phosphate permease
MPLPLMVTLLAGAGFAIGLAGPPRDAMVKSITPAGASGRTYGFVYSALDLGGVVAPLVAGALVDFGAPRAVFYAIAVFLFISSYIALRTTRAAPARVAAAGAD